MVTHVNAFCMQNTSVMASSAVAGTTWSPSVWLGRVRDLPQNVYGFENLVCGYTHLLPNPEHFFPYVISHLRGWEILFHNTPTR